MTSKAQRARTGQRGFTLIEALAALAISAVIIVTATTIGIQWRKVAGAVVAPVTLVALYAVWRWRRDD